MRHYSSAEEENRRRRDLGTLLDLPVVKRPTAQLRNHDDIAENQQESNVVGSAGAMLDAKERQYLKVIMSNPNKASSAYAKLARMSTKTALKARRRLIELGLLKEERLNANGRGRSVIVLRPTDAARRLLEKRRDETP
jgi:hypothetical protein